MYRNRIDKFKENIFILNTKNKKLKSQFRVVNAINPNNFNFNFNFNNSNRKNFIRRFVFLNRCIIIFLFFGNRYNRFNILIIIKIFIVQKFNNKYLNVNFFYKINKIKYI